METSWISTGNNFSDRQSANSMRGCSHTTVQVLDVRREPEWDAGHIENATWWPLDNFKVSPPELDRDAPRLQCIARVDTAA